MATKIKDMPDNNKVNRQKKEDLLARAQAAGLDDNATKAEVSEAEKRNQ